MALLLVYTSAGAWTLWAMPCLTARNLVDIYSRKSLILHSGISIKGEDVAEILKIVIFEQQAYPKRIKIDNGPEFISKALDRWAYERKIELEFSRPGKPTDNAFI